MFLKVDADQARIDVEVEAMALAPVPTPEVLWRKPSVLAMAAVPGTAIGRLGEPRPRRRDPDESAAELDGECELLVTNGVLPADLVTRTV